MTTKTRKQQTGAASEQRAYEYLLTQGLTLIERNYRSRFGEIDLIMKHKNAIVFIEVRTRNNTAFGTAIESINRQKQRKICQTAWHFLQKHRLGAADCRFDVIAIQQNILSWVPNAFSAEAF
jgi:putative endonuclease